MQNNIMSVDQSDFESLHNDRFHTKGESTFGLKKGKKNILLISPQSEYTAADRSFMAPALGVIRLAGFMNEKVTMQKVLSQIFQC